MKRLIVGIIFALALLCACENEYMIALLRGPSELSSLEVEAYDAEGGRLQGGVSIVPGFSPGRYEYAVYIPFEAFFFVINAGIKGDGTVSWLSEAEEEGNAFTLPQDVESKQITVRGERQYMDIADYRLTVMRGPQIPRGISIGITPLIGAFFIQSDPDVVLEVTAEPPDDGGVLSYQWYRNEDNNNRTGDKIPGATEPVYSLTAQEKARRGTMYYYAELTNTLSGQISRLESLPCAVTFIDKYMLDEKSGGGDDYFVNIAISPNTGGDWSRRGTARPDTPYAIGKYIVTYELWKTVREYAEKGGYSFGNAGEAGAYSDQYRIRMQGSIDEFIPAAAAGLHPVTQVNWTDCVIWCNAYSEMNGREPVYRYADGSVIRAYREGIVNKVDVPLMAGKNGYRLPSLGEWEYAARGADPALPDWNYRWAGGNSSPHLYVYYGGDADRSPAFFFLYDNYYWIYQTAAVGSLLPNRLGLYDMMGLVLEFHCTIRPDGLGDNFIYDTLTPGGNYSRGLTDQWGYPYDDYDYYISGASWEVGFRLAYTE